MRTTGGLLFALFCCLAMLQAAPAAAEERGRAYYDFGVFAYEDGDFEDALQKLSRAVELEPANPLYHQYLGRTYLKLEQFDKALDALTSARKADPELSGLTYDLALLRFKRQEYAKAADLFESFLAQQPDHALARYYAGVSLFKLKRYRAALPHFQRAVVLSPSIKDNGSYYIGVCHFMLRQYDQARELLTSVRDTAASETLRKSAADWLESLEDIKPWRLSLEALAGYDDNVAREPEDQPDLYVDEGDSFAGAYLQGRYNLIDSRDYRFSVDARHWQVAYPDLDEFNKSISSLQISTAYRMDRLVLGLNYTPSYYRLDGEGYGTQHEIEPVAVWEIDARRTARLSYSRAYNNYFDLPEREGHTDIARIDLYQALRQTGLIYGEVAAGRNSADHRDHEYDTFKGALGMYLKLPAELRLVLEGNYTLRDHRYADSFYDREREDRRYYLAASLSRRLFFDWLDLGAKMEYVYNDSNIDDFKYRKLATFLTLVATY